MSINTRTYTDLDFLFVPNPNTGDISKKFDDNAIKQSIRSLLLTRNYERKFHSDIGSPLHQLLFEPSGPMLNQVLKQTITNMIHKYEPRVVIQTILVNTDSDNNEVFINIIFNIINTTRPLSLDLVLQRTR